MLLKRSGRRKHHFLSTFVPQLTVFACIYLSLGGIAQAQPQRPMASAQDADATIRRLFFVSNALQERIQGAPYKGILIHEDRQEYGDSQFSVVTAFNRDTFQTVQLSGVKEWTDAARIVHNQNKTYDMAGVPIQELSIQLPQGGSLVQYWVGNRAYPSLDAAADAIRELHKVTGVDYKEIAKQFERINLEAEQMASQVPEKMRKEKPAPLYKQKIRKEPSNLVEKIEAYMGDDIASNLRRDFHTDKYFGPDASGGALYEFQNFGVARYLNTSLDRFGFNVTSAFYTARISIRGLKFFETSIDPFIEATVNLEGSARDFQNTIIPVAGLEWRPFRRSVFFSNEDKLDWVKNLRVFIQYMERKNLQGNIDFSSNNDFRFGADIFYRWGYALPDPGEKDVPYLAQLFGTATWQNTNFSTHVGDYNFVLATEILFGWKLPAIPLPENPLFDQIQLIPHVMSNVEFSSPGEVFQNRYVQSFGVMWFPFRSEKYRHIPQLHEIFLFFRYRWQTATFQDPRNRATPDYDYELGIDYTIKRF